jgi:hypothetical protein
MLVLEHPRASAAALMPRSPYMRTRQAENEAGVIRPSLLGNYILDAIADVVLAYKPKPKTNPAKKRKKRAAKISRSREASADHKSA